MSLALRAPLEGKRALYRSGRGLRSWVHCRGGQTSYQGIHRSAALCRASARLHSSRRALYFAEEVLHLGSIHDGSTLAKRSRSARSKRPGVAAGRVGAQPGARRIESSLRRTKPVSTSATMVLAVAGRSSLIMEAVALVRAGSALHQEPLVHGGHEQSWLACHTPRSHRVHRSDLGTWSRTTAGSSPSSGTSR